ncbi:YbdD/YjiX family protein [Sphingobium cloacae]|uniref:YbdD/YjiX family protein n=1 Tax=Sphingobium cloacae TaxID=120107 RepID=UPI00082CFAB8|nr:CstA-like transporter-associated (seleno)protein [Sphingobium cloacae]
MSGFLTRLRQIARAMVGAPDYDAYLRHMREHHPGIPPLSEAQLFRERQDARYGGKNGGKCC